MKQKKENEEEDHHKNFLIEKLLGEILFNTFILQLRFIVNYLGFM